MKIKLNIPDSFYSEETLCGYTVSSEMKKLWAVELDLLAQTIRVLKAHGLQYWAMGGTLLGAVRHKGFIPWDDDIDIIMPRSDYDELIRHGAEWFEPPYFFQTPCTEKGFFRSHIQIRNTETTGYIPKDLYRPCCKGVFIDIFVLDEVPDQQWRRWLHIRHANLIRSIGVLAMDKGSQNLAKYGLPIKPFAALAHKIACRNGSFSDWFLRYNRVLAKYNGRGYHSRAHTTILYHEGKCWKDKDFSSSVVLPFHMLELNCPVDSLSVLKKQYGDSVLQIPQHPPATTHGGILFDTEHPFTGKE